MNRMRWGLVAGVVLVGALVTSGCGLKCVGKAEYEQLMTYESLAKKQSKEISALLADLAELEAQRDAVEGKLAELQEARGSDEAMLQQYKETFDAMKAKMGDLQTERDREAARADKLQSEVARLNEMLKGPGGEIADAPEGATVIRERDRIGVRIPNTLLFPSGSATLSDKGLNMIREVAKMQDVQNPEIFLSIEGHTDSDPVKASKIYFKDNYDLSAERARTVMLALHEQGIALDRMQIVGHGPNKLITDNGKESKAKSRRVEIFMMRPYGSATAEM
jgi:chemotaxis protein MotB